MGEDDDHVRAVPAPLIVFVTAVFGFALGWMFPFRFLPWSVAYLVGAIMIVMGLIVGASALVAMRRAHTSPNPNKPTVALVESGVFRFSRNPMYLSMFLLYLSFATFVNDVWLLPLFLLLFLLVDRLVITREEKYLEQKFGDNYKRYEERVRRWI